MAPTGKKPTFDLSILEPIVDQLLSGNCDSKDIARRLEALGFPTIHDPTEQLRLALQLLENRCKDASGKEAHGVKRGKPRRLEADLT